VVDASQEGIEQRMAAVHKVLANMGLRERPEILVFNKIDALPPGEGARIAAQYGGVAVSAAQQIGFESVLERAEFELFDSQASPVVLTDTIYGERERSFT
jgi:GTPase